MFPALGAAGGTSLQASSSATARQDTQNAFSTVFGDKNVGAGSGSLSPLTIGLLALVALAAVFFLRKK